MVRSRFPGVPIFACTASATEACRRDMRTVLFGPNSTGARVFVDSFNRPNLSFVVKQKETNLTKNNADQFFQGIVDTIRDSLQQDYMRNLSSSSAVAGSYHSNAVDGNQKKLSYHAHHAAAQAANTGCCVIYALSKVECETVAKGLQKCGLKARPYHAGLPIQTRRTNQEQWMSGKIQVIVATIAFGMGINKADVRFIGHLVMPSSLERYYQECGRAGRDGRHATCVCWYSDRDYERCKRLVTSGGGPAGASSSKFLTQLLAMRSFLTQKIQCRRKALLEYFGERNFDAKNCGKKCDICATVDRENAHLLNITTEQRQGTAAGAGNATSTAGTSSGGNIFGASSLLQHQHGINMSSSIVQRDFTSEAKVLVNYLRDCLSCELTVAKLRDASLGVSLPKPAKKKGRRGGKSQWLQAAEDKREKVMNHKSFGFLKNTSISQPNQPDQQLSKHGAEQVVRKLVELQVFSEIVKTSGGGGRKKRGRRGKSAFSWSILQVGPRATDLQWNRLRVSVDLDGSTAFAGTTTGGGAPKSSSGVGASSSSSAFSRNNQQTGLDSDDIEEFGSSDDDETSDSAVVAAADAAVLAQKSAVQQGTAATTSSGSTSTGLLGAARQQTSAFTTAFSLDLSSLDQNSSKRTKTPAELEFERLQRLELEKYKRPPKQKPAVVSAGSSSSSSANFYNRVGAGQVSSRPANPSSSSASSRFNPLFAAAASSTSPFDNPLLQLGGARRGGAGSGTSILGSRSGPAVQNQEEDEIISEATDEDEKLFGAGRSSRATMNQTNATSSSAGRVVDNRPLLIAEDKHDSEEEGGCGSSSSHGGSLLARLMAKRRKMNPDNE
ncbi:unnamed protein product [Amoebophrya sp. A120]|nr:unnamed protein product [Amoebophrya sp. A120]|eukprot:GSA120T00024235001.1